MPHLPSKGPVLANKSSAAPVPLSTRSTLEKYTGNSDEFRAKLRQKELEQARWLQEQQLKAAEDPVLSPAQIEELAHKVNITSRSAVEPPHKVAVGLLVSLIFAEDGTD